MLDRSGIMCYTKTMAKKSGKKNRKRRDLNETAKLIVNLATGEISPDPINGKNPAAVALGRLGGLKGGRARAERLSKEERSEIARMAALARWKKG